MTEQLKKKGRSSEPAPAPQPTCNRRFFILSCDMLTSRVAEPFQSHDPLFNVSFDTNFTFGSEAANLEYSILSAILGNNPSPPESGGTAPSPSQPQQVPEPLPNSTWSPEPLHTQPQYMQATSTFGSPFGDQAQLSMPQTDALSASQQPSTFLASYPPAQLYPRTASPALQYPYAQPQPQMPVPSHPLAPHYSRNIINLGPSGIMRTPSRDTRSHSYESSSHTSPSPTIQSGDHHSVRVYFRTLYFTHLSRLDPQCNSSL